MDNGWVRKKKGMARIYTKDGIDRAIVIDFKGCRFNGVYYTTLEEAKIAAEEYGKHPNN